MTTKNKKKKKRPSTTNSRNQNAVHSQIPRPSVTEYFAVTSVPVFPYGPAGSPNGGTGDYDITYVLGVPGADDVTTAGLDVEQLLMSGTSLIAGGSFVAQLVPTDGGEPSSAELLPNSSGRLARVRTSVSAKSFEEAETIASNLVMPLLSWLAFTTDTAVDAVALVMKERATSIIQIGATIAGRVKALPNIEAITSTELAPFLAAYREGMSSNSPLYQVLSFYKVLEGIKAHDTRRRRSKNGAVASPSPLAQALPSRAEELPFSEEMERAPFIPFLGKSFEQIANSVSDTIRNAIAHLSQGKDGVKVADSIEDVRVCRRISPVLRYMAHRVIEDELKLLQAESPVEANGATQSTAIHTDK